MTGSGHRAAGPDERGLSLAVVTVSDTRVVANDLGGAEAARLFTEAGFPAPTRYIVADDVDDIRAIARKVVAGGQGNGGGADAIVFTGGTGFSPRDVTVEALVPLFERHLAGFGELFRMLSFAEIGAAAMLSRATAGILSGVPIFLTPGSPAGVRLAVERLILPELRHLLGQVRRTS
jgi:molybdenum cofactor biosynthesis protein B